MSVEFEIEADNVVLMFDAYSTEAIVTLTDHDDGEDSGVGATYTADQLRQLRRFLEYTYPASEDPPARTRLTKPDPWEAKSGGVPNSGGLWVDAPRFPDGGGR